MKLERTDLDRTIWEEELEEFVPREIYDMHTHVCDLRPDSPDVDNTEAPAGAHADWPLADWATMNRVDAVLMPGRTVHRLSFGTPYQNAPLEQINAFTLREVRNDPMSAGLALVRPDWPPESLDKALGEGLRGVKPYRFFARSGDPVQCRIPDFMPEEQLAVVDRHGGFVMLHMSRREAIADPANLDDLERLTASFPQVRWILAHCARSYYERPLRLAGERLRNMPNTWFDISSVCDSDAIETLLELAGPRRVMYGTDDLAVGVTRGKYITFGHSWAGLREENHRLDLSHCDGRMTFTRYECLRALRKACRRLRYDRETIRGIFFDNGRELLA